MSLNTAPPLAAPKTQEKYWKFDPVPETGPQVAVIAGYNFLENYTPNYPDAKLIAQAVEMFYGVKAEDGKWFFVKTFPSAYSTHEKSNYAKLTKAATGSLPEAGGSVNDLIGKAVMVNIENIDKVGKKGNAYTISKMAGDPSPVPKAMLSAVPDGQEAIAEFNTEIQRQEAEDSPSDDHDEVPF